MGLLTALPSAADDRIILTIGDISDRTSSRMDGEGFYFFPQKIGYNGVGYSNSAYNRGYIVRWDYYKELGYPPINNEEDYLNVLLQMHANHPCAEEGPEEILRMVRIAVDAFVGDAEQFDDLTMLCIEYKGKELL